MRNIFVILFTLVSFANIYAQSSQKYLEEAYSLIKVKSFNPNTNSKKCDVYAYLRAGDLSKKATYLIELKRKGNNETVFRSAINLNDLDASEGVLTYRQNEDVYEFFYGLWVVYDDTYMQVVVIEENGNRITIPATPTDYKNPITIMN